MAKKIVTLKLNSSALERQMREALKKNPKVTTQKVSAIAMDLAGKSASRAPVETGDLRNNCVAKVNGKVTFENGDETGNIAKSTARPFATVGYSLPYALRQHEELNYSHDRTDGNRVNRKMRYKTKDGKISTFLASATVNKVAGGEAKFLENPFKENEDKYIEKLKSIPKELLK